MKYRQRVLSKNDAIPEGFVRDPELARKAGGSSRDPEGSLYRQALLYASRGLMPSCKVMATSRHRRGHVYLPANWREVTVAELAKSPNVRNPIILAARMPAAPTGVGRDVNITPVKAVARPDPNAERAMAMLECLIDEQARTNALLERLVNIWDAPARG